MRRRDFLRAALVVPLLAGCGQDDDAIPVDLAKRVDITVRTPPRSLTYAYLPQYAHTVSYERHRLLLEYLTRATGLPLRQVFPDTFEEHVRMKLKKMSGVEVLEEIGKRSPATKVIMLTGYPTLETARESVRLGACEYCVKPIDKDELERKVAETLAGTE